MNGLRWTVVLAAVAVTAAAAIQAADAGKDNPGWFQWLGPNHDGISTEKGWSADFPEGKAKIDWKAELGLGFSSMTVRDGRVYTLGNTEGTETVWCLDAKKGQLVWKYTYSCPLGEHPGPRATPADDGKNVYTLSRMGQFFCFDAAKGEVKWSKDLAKEFGVKAPVWGFACSPLLYDDWVIVDVGTVIAFRRATGEVVWKSEAYPVGFASPMPFVMGSSRRLAIFNSGGLVILNAADGKELLRFPWKTKPDVNAVTPIVSGKTAFISSGYGTGGALVDISGEEPKAVWQNKKMCNHFTTCMLIDGHLYGFNEATLTCMELATGEVKWTQAGLGKGSLMAADGKLIVISESGELVIVEVSPKEYKPLARAKVTTATCWTPPVLAEGRIYVRNDKGNLVCVDVSGQAEATP